jgi:hypothetical protein
MGPDSSPSKDRQIIVRRLQDDAGAGCGVVGGDGRVPRAVRFLFGRHVVANCGVPTSPGPPAFEAECLDRVVVAEEKVGREKEGPVSILFGTRNARRNGCLQSVICIE